MAKPDLTEPTIDTFCIMMGKWCAMQLNF